MQWSLLLLFVVATDVQCAPQQQQYPAAVWADEIDSWSPVSVVTAANTAATALVNTTQHQKHPPAVWADEIDQLYYDDEEEIDNLELSPRSDIIDDHNSSPITDNTQIDRTSVKGKTQIFINPAICRKCFTEKDDAVANLGNSTRQLGM